MSTWSFISEMSGETTSATPSPTSAGAWKQSDLPPPVGITTSESRPGQDGLHRLLLQRPEGRVAPVALEDVEQGGRRRDGGGIGSGGDGELMRGGAAGRGGPCTW